MTFTCRLLPLVALVIGLSLASGCGRTDMGVLARGAGDGASGICAEAPCLASLFQGCVPEGSCTWEGGSSPGGRGIATCYSNGVSVSDVELLNPPIPTGSVTVARNGTRCYSIDRSSPLDGDVASYVFRDANGQQVATGTTTVDKIGSSVVTCNGSTATAVSDSCMNPTGDSSGCDMATCDISGCDMGCRL